MTMFISSFDHMGRNGSIATLCTTLLEGCGIKSMPPIFKVNMLIYQSKATLDVKILLGNIAHLIDPEIRKILERGLYGSQDSTVCSGPWFTCH